MKVAIVGAGIGGLATALALGRDGHDVTVVERRTGFGEAGAGIQVSPNASRILIEFGLGPDLARVGVEPDRVAVRDMRSGRPIGAMPLGVAMRTRFGAPYYSVARADLHTALLDAVRRRPNVRLLVGRGLAGAADGDGTAAITVETEAGGREVLDADLAVGADGVWSRCRAALGDIRDPVPAGLGASRALVPASRIEGVVPANETGLWLGRSRHVVHYPVEGGRTINLVAVAPETSARRGWTEPEGRDAVLARFADAAPALKAVLGSVESWSTWSLFDLPAQRIAGRRVVLVGDAAHPILPFLAQGGALAIEDAADLAIQIRHHGADVPAALRAFATVRRARAVRVQAETRRNGRTFHLGRPASLARDLVLRRLSPERALERYSWLYGWGA